MVAATTLEENPRLSEARALLEQRGIFAEDEDYSTRELTRELSRRGWRWNLSTTEAEASKAYLPPGAAGHSIVVEGSNPSATLTIVLADAVRYDEEHKLYLTDPYRPDIEVRDPSNRVVALVEIKNSQFLTIDYVTTFRRDRIVYDRLDADVPFFLMMSQDVGYLWDRRSGSHPFARPSLQFSMNPVMQHYAPWLEPEQRLTGLGLTLVVTQWLREIALRNPSRPRAIDHVFDETGLLKALEGSFVEMSVRE